MMKKGRSLLAFKFPSDGACSSGNYPEAKFGVGLLLTPVFYYDIDINAQLNEGDLRKIEQRMEEISKKNNPFTREKYRRKNAVKFLLIRKETHISLKFVRDQ